MSKILRAAGFAAAVFSVVAGATFAAPSLASEDEATAVQPRFTDHAAAAIEPGTLALNTLDKASLSPTLSGLDLPSADHLTATGIQSAIEETETKPSTEVAEDAPVRSLSEMVNDYASSEVPDAEQECLAIAVYYEAKSETLKGQLTVADVIRNRTRSGRFPASLCGVVKQRGQFSFVRGGKLPDVPRQTKQWRTAVAIAHIAMSELAEGSAPRALFFHARHASPGWKLTRVASVGNHIFYR